MQTIEHSIEALLGAPVRTPRRRSSDLGAACDPRGYLIGRRLGIVPRLSESEAMNRGSWLHEAMRVRGDAWQMEQQLQERMIEIRNAAADLGADADRLVHTEQQEWASAMAVFDAGSQVVFKDERRRFQGTFLDWLCYWNIAGTELLVADDRDIAQLDYLLVKGDEAWIMDVKTTAKQPTERAAGCTLEQQTSHYLAVTNRNWEKVCEARGIDCKLMGMIHLIVQTARLRMSQEDRDFEEYDHTLKSGPRKGTVIRKRTYSGEPKYENYLERVKHWYLATGPYEHLVGEVAIEPRVNVSYTPIGAVARSSYPYWRDELERWRQEPCKNVDDVKNFPIGPHVMHQVSNTKPFYLLDPVYWPSIIATDGFHFVNRDENLPDPDGRVHVVEWR